ncbi:MAG: hypothetical protein N2Z62_14540 [Rhodobacteraceae bacterium]|nr:hypothetical protein [Paracoccaceae bacterium]
MEGDHIFIASGDSCPICTALHGAVVPPGYKAHANCHCQTVRRPDGEPCDWTMHTMTHRNGSGPMDAILEINVEVACPDGSVAGAQTSMDLSGYGDSDAEFDRLAADAEHLAEDLATDLCTSCPPPRPVS